MKTYTDMGTGETLDTSDPRTPVQTIPTTSVRRIRRGMRVETTGLGRTATWGRYTGRVERVRADQVFVKWNDSFVSDQLNIEEVREIQA